MNRQQKLREQRLQELERAKVVHLHIDRLIRGLCHPSVKQYKSANEWRDISIKVWSKITSIEADLEDV